MAPTIVLITGGNRGLGQGLVKTFLAEPNYVSPSLIPGSLTWRHETDDRRWQTVIAAVRDPGHSTAQALAGLPQGPGSTLITVQYDAGREQGAADAVAQLRQKHGLDHLDIVVANAGISKSWPFVKDVKRAEIQEHVGVNVAGVVELFQATRDLLQRSTTKKPVFAAVGSLAGSLA